MLTRATSPQVTIARYITEQLAWWEQSSTNKLDFSPTTFPLFNIFLLVSQTGNSLLSIQLSLLSVFNLIMLDSWIDEVHASARCLCIFFLSPLLNFR